RSREPELTGQILGEVPSDRIQVCVLGKEAVSRSALGRISRSGCSRLVLRLYVRRVSAIRIAGGEPSRAPLAVIVQACSPLRRCARVRRGMALPGAPIEREPMAQPVCTVPAKRQLVVWRRQVGDRHRTPWRRAATAGNACSSEGLLDFGSLQVAGVLQLQRRAEFFHWLGAKSDIAGSRAEVGPQAVETKVRFCIVASHTQGGMERQQS